MSNNALLHQAILARDIIDMARDNAANPDILEYVESICWELFMIFTKKQYEDIQWDRLSGAFDQMHTMLRAGEGVHDWSDVDAIYSKAARVIADGYGSTQHSSKVKTGYLNSTDANRTH